MLTAFCILLTFSAADIDPPAFFAANDELRGYLLEAAENHPQLKARYAEWRAALEKIPQAKSLEDPMFSYMRFVRSMSARSRVDLAQKFPWFGVLRARGDQAAAEADAALAMLYAERNALFADVKKAYFEYAYLGESTRLTESQAELLKYMEETVRSKYEYGLANQDELLRMQIEKDLLQDRYNQFNQFRPALSARLRAALGHGIGEELPWPQTATLPPTPPPGPIAVARARVANPELESLEHMIESRRQGIALAKKTRFPEITLEFRYGSMKRPPEPPKRTPILESLGAANNLLTGGSMSAIETAMNLNTLSMLDRELDGMPFRDDVMVMVSMNVPIRLKRIRASIEEAKQMETAAENQKDKKALDLDSAVHAALFGIQDGERRRNLYHDSLIPQAQQAYESLQSTYASGMMIETGFLDLLEGVRRVLEFQLEEAAAIKDIQMSAAELEMLLGGPWTSEAPTEEPKTP
ncbi:MAG: TolC family protein [Candidatus Hydrogenedentes bacterium]|nr:TolC family protein [Candidatus Hydrogenedentota bacterium]